MTSEKICFVIMPYGGSDQEAREKFMGVFTSIIEPAAVKAGYKPKRSDIESSPGSITHDIVNNLLTADIVIADLTSANPNVLYELGIRHAFRKSGTVHIIEESCQVPFDVKSYRFIKYSLKLANIPRTVSLISEAIKMREESAGKSDNPVHDARHDLPVNFVDSGGVPSVNQLGNRQEFARPDRRRDLRYVHSSTDLFPAFYDISIIQHHMIHRLRDICIEILPTTPAYSSPFFASNSDRRPKPNPQLTKYRSEIVSLLERMVELFRPFVPDSAKLWSCLRDRRADNCYHTFERAGRFDQNRKVSTSPLHKDNSQVVSNLKKRYKEEGVCVLITGSSCGPEMWEVKENDGYGEDKSVMLGAVLTRSWDSGAMELINPKLAWIIGVCTDHENAFNEMHIPAMRQCVDVFSVLANIMIRYQEDI